MGRIPEDTIREIRDRADIVGVIGRYVELKKAGRNFKGLCPFHGEKTPSFNVSPDKQIYHCFGCGEGGDVISFLMGHDSLTFPEAARTVAQEFGIEIPESDSGERGLSERVFAANDVAQSAYRDCLRSDAGSVARKYLERRGLDAASIDRFGLGFVPNRWDTVVNALAKAGVDADLGEQAGLIARRKEGRGHYDRLRGRVTFPIQDVRGRWVGFGGRALEADQEPKYVNSPESPVFQKRRAFYGYPFALEGIRQTDRVVICEGYFDRIALHRAGVIESLATCGTAMTAEHGAELKRRTRQVVLLFDGDAAGQKAVARALETLLPHGLRVRAAQLPAGEDPDTYLERNGAEALAKLVDEAQDALEMVIRRALSQGWATPTQKADAIESVAPLIALIPNRIERDEYGRRLALSTETEAASVQSVVSAVSRGRSESAATIEEAAVPMRRISSEDRHLRDLAILLYRHPQLGARQPADELIEMLPGGSWKAIVSHLLSASQRADREGRSAPDLFGLEESLDDEARARLREVAVNDTLTDTERPIEDVFDDLVRRFAKRRIDARMKELTRQMRDPGADTDALLQEKHECNEQARAMRASS